MKKNYVFFLIWYCCLVYLWLFYKWEEIWGKFDFVVVFGIVIGDKIVFGFLVMFL